MCSADLAKNAIDKIVAAYKSGNFYNGGATGWSALTDAVENMRRLLNKRYGRGLLKK